MSDPIDEIHVRLGRIEGKLDVVVANNESLRWVKRHLWALWTAIATLIGMKAGGH